MERWNVDAVQIVPPPLLDDGVDALRVRTPRVGAYGESPSRGRLDDVATFRLSILPPDQHQPHAVGLEPGPLQRQVREPAPVRRVARRVIGAAAWREHMHAGA